MSTLQSQIDRLHRRIRMILAPALIQTTDDTGSLLKGQIKINGTPEVIDPIGIMYAYGYHANPPPDTDATALFLSGDRSNPIVVATNHQQSRPRNYKPGEIGIYTNEGDTVTLNRENKLNITSKDRVTVKGTNKVALDTPLTEISKDVKAFGKIDASEGFFKNGVAMGGAGAPGAAGPPGPQGPPGATGPAGIYQAGPGIAINTGTAPPTISTAAPYLPLSGGTITGPLTISNTVGGGYGGQFAITNTSAGATNINKFFRISASGTLEIVNSAFSAVSFQFTDSGDFNASGRIYASGTVFNTNSVAATGAFHMAPNSAGTAYGSFWYNDGSLTYLLLTNNNDALGAYNGLRPFYVDDATGLVGMGHGLNLTSGALQLASVSFATQDATFHHLRDKSGRAAILLGGTADSENYYDNTIHRFRGVNGATYDYSIDSSGITLQNSIAFRGRKTDNSTVNLAYIDSGNSVIIGGYGSALPCFVGSGGSYFATDGSFYAAQHIVLKNGFSLFAGNAAATANYPVIGVASDNRIKINPALAYNVDAYGQWDFRSSITATDVTALGAGAVLVFADRAAAASGAWGWYASGGIARLWNAGSGDRVTVDTAGNMTFAGNYYYFAGGTGSVNAAGGPFLYFDSNYIIAHTGSGNAGFRVQDANGRYVGGVDTLGWFVSLDNRQTILRDANFTQIKDAAGNTSIFLGGTADPSNYHRNTTHRFQGIGGGQDFLTLSAGNCVPQNHLYPATDNTSWCGYTGFTSWYGVTAYNFVNASDARDKEEIRELPDCLDLLRKIQPKRYKFNNGPEHDRDRVHWGFVAQEVGKAMQDAGHDFGGHYIGDDEAQSQGLSTNDLVAVLWKACQELTARVQSLEGERRL